MKTTKMIVTLGEPIPYDKFYGVLEMFKKVDVGYVSVYYGDGEEDYHTYALDRLLQVIKESQIGDNDNFIITHEVHPIDRSIKYFTFKGVTLN